MERLLFIDFDLKRICTLISKDQLHRKPISRNQVAIHSQFLQFN